MLLFFDFGFRPVLSFYSADGIYASSMLLKTKGRSNAEQTIGCCKHSLSISANIAPNNQSENEKSS